MLAGVEKNLNLLVQCRSNEVSKAAINIIIKKRFEHKCLYNNFKWAYLLREVQGAYMKGIYWLII